MRLVGCGVFVIAGTLLGAVLLSRVVPDDVSPVVPRLGGIVLFLVMCGVGLALFRPFGRPEDVPIAETEFQATRAFQVEEWEDEGPHYYLELADGGVLYLNGQYLMEYGPYEDEELQEGPRPRQFPCTEFTVRRHAEVGFVTEIVCRGSALEPEVVTPPINPYREDKPPEDGDIIRDRSYDDIKAERMRG